MATETVSAFSPVTLSYDKDAINGFTYNNDGHLSDSDTFPSKQSRNYYKRRSNMSDHELVIARERDRIQSRKRREKAELKQQQDLQCIDTVYSDFKNIENDCRDHEKEEVDQVDLGAKKKKNTKKRSRSDMSPEELLRLRERERKAQQSRRDRIRAQKRKAQGWHDDDAAWEAFLDQAENTTDSNDDQMKPHFASSIPSMVLSSQQSSNEKVFTSDIFRENATVKEEENELPSDHLMNNSDGMFKSEKIVQKQDSIHSNDTDTNSGSYHDGEIHYSSDDNQMDAQPKVDSKENVKKKLSRRHYLPSEELERLRKRERDAKRKQRERHRLANMGAKSPLKPNMIGNDYEIKEELGKDLECKKQENPSTAHIYKTPDHHVPLADPLGIHPKAITSSDSTKIHASNHSAPSKLDCHFPLIYMSDTHHHHHYSPTQYIREGHHLTDVHYPNYVVDGQHYHSESYKLDHYHKDQMIPIVHQTPVSVECISSPDHSKSSNSTSPSNALGDKKKVVSRNVDRKKLSEAELEELRKRERDYQRERRARIRMEKAKSQANQEHYQMKSCDETMPHFYHSPLYRSQSALHLYHEDLLSKEKSFSGIANCEANNRLDYHQYSSHCHLDKQEKSVCGRNFLPLSMPSDMRYERSAVLSADDNRDTDLLQVVPKNRDCEAMTASPTCDVKTCDDPPEKNDSKAGVLEVICSNLKQESEWSDNSHDNHDDDDDDDDDDDGRLVIVQPSDLEKDENMEEKVEGSSLNLNKSKEELVNGNVFHVSGKRLGEKSVRDRIMEEQLERRRRSNREAQRRRRARLRFQEYSEERPDSAGEIKDYRSLQVPPHLDDIKIENRMLPNGCRVKMTPSTHPEPFYSDRFLPFHTQHHVKMPHNHIYERYGHDVTKSLHHSDKHCLFLPHRSQNNLEAHKYSHYISEHIKSERYSRDTSFHHNHHGSEEHLHEIQEHEKYARVPSIDDFDIYRNDIGRDTHKLSSASTSPSALSTPMLDNGIEVERSKPSRKRKQNAPRKVLSSSTNPDEEVDVCAGSELVKDKSVFSVSDDAPKEVHMNGDDNYESISTEQVLNEEFVCIGKHNAVASA